MEEDKNSQDGFPVFKGLQKPLEFMGGNLPGSSPCW